MFVEQNKYLRAAEGTMDDNTSRLDLYPDIDSLPRERKDEKADKCNCYCSWFL